MEALAWFHDDDVSIHGLPLNLPISLIPVTNRIEQLLLGLGPGDWGPFTLGVGLVRSAGYVGPA